METTNNFLNWVEIKNFKSIDSLTLKDCKRVNVFIGKPNVGKSNILEALGLLGANYSTEKFMEGAVRYKELKHLYRDSDLNQTVQIQSDRLVGFLRSHTPNPHFETTFQFWLSTSSAYKSVLKRGKHYSDLNNNKNTYSLSIQKNGIFQVNKYPNSVNFSNVKKYDFTNLTEFNSLFQDFLLPPHGSNLYEVVKRREDIADEFVNLFKAQNLDFVLDEDDQTFVIQRKQGPIVYQNGFFSIADTFRRFMFYITAIESNKDSVIILEEPEVHSFPPYTLELAYRIVHDDDNQYFISTHSPYLLHTLIENLKDDQLNVFISYYENYETKVKAMTPDELRDVLDFSTDVFFNLDKFLPNAGRPVSA